LVLSFGAEQSVSPLHTREHMPTAEQNQPAARELVQQSPPPDSHNLYGLPVNLQFVPQTPLGAVSQPAADLSQSSPKS
jgi:hypothetical protein